jgi:hypothetical protein
MLCLLVRPDAGEKIMNTALKPTVASIASRALTVAKAGPRAGLTSGVYFSPSANEKDPGAWSGVFAFVAVWQLLLTAAPDRSWMHGKLGRNRSQCLTIAASFPHLVALCIVQLWLSTKSHATGLRTLASVASAGLD